MNNFMRIEISQNWRMSGLIDKNFIIEVEMQVLLRREGRRGGVMLKNRCRFFFDGKKTRFSKMQMALGGEQAGTCFSFVSYVLRFRT